MAILRFVAVAVAISAACLASSVTAEQIVIDSVLLTIIDQAEVPAREAGILEELVVREGDRVQAGQIIGRLDDEAAALARDRAGLDLEQAQKLASNDIKLRLAKKELEIAQAELGRATKASERLSNSVSPAELDRLKLDVERAALQVEQSEFETAAANVVVRIQENELRAAEERLRRRRLIAPIAGTVVSIQRHLGEALEAGQTVIRLIATDQLRAEGYLPVDQLSGELLGREIELVVRSAERKQHVFSGEIIFIHPEVDPVAGQARVWARIDNREGKLRPGLSGTLTISP